MKTRDCVQVELGLLFIEVCETYRARDGHQVTYICVARLNGVILKRITPVGLEAGSHKPQVCRYGCQLFLRQVYHASLLTESEKVDGNRRRLLGRRRLFTSSTFEDLEKAILHSQKTAHSFYGRLLLALFFFLLQVTQIADHQQSLVHLILASDHFLGDFF